MTKRQRFLVRFWGARGSYPTPGLHTVRHGGNTSCIEVQAGEHILILDAGSGIIGLGNAVLKRTNVEPLHIALLITHGHADHLIGLPFFAPLFESRTVLCCLGPCMAGRTIEQLVTPLMSAPYFPVDIRELPSQRTFYTIVENQYIIWRQGSNKPEIVTNQQEMRDAPLRVLVQFTQSHPSNGATFYRVEYGDRSLVYATDVEWNEHSDPDFLAFAHGADLLIHDAQYTTADYQRAKHGFGHSTVAMATSVANAAHVHELILFHHEPTYDDDQLDRMEAEAQTQFAHTRSAYEGLEIDLLAATKE